ncbi:glycosyltransferase [Streptococcus pneumoniae]|nr:glycosyltransferase family 2 protein [Streptococcus pneumoniae]CYK60897.1 glycosyltransferase [Streptococcus pneumoniae]
MDRNIDQELVSIIIPTHNRYESLIRAVKSCLHQSYKNIEVIIIDDNYSNVNLRNKIIHQFGYTNHRIKLILSNEDLGATNARNIGIKNSRGKYISFLDDDDEYMPDRILKLMACFKKSRMKNLALVYSYGIIIYPNGTREEEKTDFVGNPLFVQMVHNIAGTSFSRRGEDRFCWKSLVCSNGSHQDGVVLLKLLAQGYQIDIVREFLVNYYAHSKENGITGVTQKTINADEEYYNYCRKYFNLLSFNERILVTKKYYSLNIKRLLLIGDKCKALKVIKKAREEKIFNEFLF